MPDKNVDVDPEKLVPIEKYGDYLKAKPDIKRPKWFPEDEFPKGIKEEEKVPADNHIIGRNIQSDSEGSRCNLDNENEENF